jgi:hypothetical protein
MSVVMRRLLASVAVGLVLAGLLTVGLAMMGPPPSLKVLAGLILPRGHAFKPAEIDLPPCVDRSPIVVSTLADQPRSTCDPTGIELVLPDGHRMTVGPPLATHAEETFGNAFDGPTYSTVSFGIYGVCVAERSGDNTKSWWWGRAEAIKFCQEGDTDAPTIHD